jgi:hypothetical protein
MCRPATDARPDGRRSRSTPARPARSSPVRRQSASCDSIEPATGLTLPKRDEARTEGAGNAGNAPHADGPACHTLAATQIRL